MDKDNILVGFFLVLVSWKIIVMKNQIINQLAAFENNFYDYTEQLKRIFFSYYSIIVSNPPSLNIFCYKNYLNVHLTTLKKNFGFEKSSRGCFFFFYNIGTICPSETNPGFKIKMKIAKWLHAIRHVEICFEAGNSAFSDPVFLDASFSPWLMTNAMQH